MNKGSSLMALHVMGNVHAMAVYVPRVAMLAGIDFVKGGGICIAWGEERLLCKYSLSCSVALHVQTVE